MKEDNIFELGTMFYLHFFFGFLTFFNHEHEAIWLSKFKN
jgi:hypothetical protein